MQFPAGGEPYSFQFAAGAGESVLQVGFEFLAVHPTQTVVALRTDVADGSQSRPCACSWRPGQREPP